MKFLLIAVFILFGFVTGYTQAAPARVDVASASIHPSNATPLKVTSADFADGQAIPLKNSSYGESISPQLQWSQGPAGTKSYAILLEDENGVRDGKAIVHWILYDIPASTTSLAPGLAKDAQLSVPEAARQGITISGKTGYLGPKPREPDHHYHFQVFALDALLQIPAGTTREAFLTAIEGHVLAKGSLVGVFSPPPAN